MSTSRSTRVIRHEDMKIETWRSHESLRKGNAENATERLQNWRQSSQSLVHLWEVFNGPCWRTGCIEQNIFYRNVKQNMTDCCTFMKTTPRGSMSEELMQSTSISCYGICHGLRLHFNQQCRGQKKQKKNSAMMNAEVRPVWKQLTDKKTLKAWLRPSCSGRPMVLTVS